MVIKNVNLALVCGVTSKIPAGSLPEFAFAGRSNVGKSTLINGLMNRKSLARVSSQPGKTQTINYYEINGAFHLVDLPGYGYAKANVRVKEQWGKMIERYLRTTDRLRAVFLLLDIRHEPSALDVQMYDWILQTGRTPVIIATKADKVKRSQVPRQLDLLRRTLRDKSAFLQAQKKARRAGKAADGGDHAGMPDPGEAAPSPSASGLEGNGGATMPAVSPQGRDAGSAPAGPAPLRIIPWSGLTKAGREEIYAVLDGLLGEGI